MESNQESSAKSNIKPHDLGSIMKLLKEYEVPTAMKPMQNVVYSTVQMFAASWLANTQTFCKYHDELAEQNEYIQRLEQKINNMEQTISQNQPQNVAHSIDSVAINKKLKHIEQSVQTLSKRVQLNEEKQQTQSKKSNNIQKVVHHEYDTNIVKALTQKSAKMQEVLEVHAKKIRELIKRYRKEHGETVQVKNQITALEKQVEFMQENNNNNVTENINTDQIVLIVKKLEELKQTTTTDITQMKDDLSGHEMEHEGIINQIIGQLENLKGNINELESKLGNDSGSNGNSNGINQEVIDNAVANRTEKIQKEHKIMVHKIIKMEKWMSKIAPDTFKSPSKKSTPKIRVTSPVSSHPSHVHVNKSHHQPTVIQFDLNTSSSTTEIGNNVSTHQGIAQETPIILHSPASSPGSAKRQKRRIRSASFGERNYSKPSTRSNKRHT